MNKDNKVFIAEVSEVSTWSFLLILMLALPSIANAESRYQTDCRNSWTDELSTGLQGNFDGQKGSGFLAQAADARRPLYIAAASEVRLDTLKLAVSRARAGGRPLELTQIGDSHIHYKVETESLAARFAKENGLTNEQLTFSSYGNPGKTAPYANQHAEEFLQNVSSKTDLVVVSFGSNESREPVAKEYTIEYADFIGKIRQRAPGAAIVMVGPTDGNIYQTNRHLPYLEDITKVQASVAARVSDAAYISVAFRMGSVAAMKSAGLILEDNLHLTSEGYTKLGKMIADDISQLIQN